MVRYFPEWEGGGAGRAGIRAECDSRRTDTVRVRHEQESLHSGRPMPEPKLHDWHIEPREYERQIERRGRKHAFERLDPGRTALVVIDMISFFVGESGYCLGIVPNIARLADVVR